MGSGGARGRGCLHLFDLPAQHVRFGLVRLTLTLHDLRVGLAKLQQPLEELHLAPPDFAHQVAALETVHRHLRGAARSVRSARRMPTWLGSSAVRAPPSQASSAYPIPPHMGAW